MIRSLIAGLLLLTAVSAHAQEAAEQEEKREFSVELILFTYAENVGTGSEIFLPEESDETTGFGLPEFVDTTHSQVESRAESSAGYLPEFTVTPESEFVLKDAADRLRRLDVYDVVLHTGWTQEAVPESDALAITLDMIAPPPPGFDGSFTLYLSRFLHLVVDLELDANGDSLLPVAVERPASRSFGRMLAEKKPLSYRINEDRIFRSGELRYFDHPKFGVLVQVSRYEPPELEIDSDEPSSGSATTVASD